MVGRGLYTGRMMVGCSIRIKLQGFLKLIFQNIYFINNKANDIQIQQKDLYGDNNLNSNWGNTNWNQAPYFHRSHVPNVMSGDLWVLRDPSKECGCLNHKHHHYKLFASSHSLFLKCKVSCYPRLQDIWYQNWANAEADTRNLSFFTYARNLKFSKM